MDFSFLISTPLVSAGFRTAMTATNTSDYCFIYFSKIYCKMRDWKPGEWANQSRSDTVTPSDLICCPHIVVNEPSQGFREIQQPTVDITDETTDVLTVLINWPLCRLKHKHEQQCCHSFFKKVIWLVITDYVIKLLYRLLDFKSN